MSIMAKLTGGWQNDSDAIRDAIVVNICSLIASRAPIWMRAESEQILAGTIAHIGLGNIARSQSKSNSDVLVADISEQLRLFEPRLAEVEIELNEESSKSNLLQFRISAVMHLELGDEAIVLDSFLDFSRNKLDVRKSNFV
ncbi:type VI secretion system baseplate subunit TssE [Vibrio aestuarianus]|uniref:type VI secretion system baseplate subunit TssE n=1 Tax=Vibrio aestuarianus TaxID=28171 RepID=UPI00237CCDF9|nr:type VI secretion system baseplate subunit TssE [Vibrio aestuarianus]MDE1254697.1 type VI secretion system baseplate subunit TssE [Vibrio aestuarianus]